MGPRGDDGETARAYRRRMTRPRLHSTSLALLCLAAAVLPAAAQGAVAGTYRGALYTDSETVEKWNGSKVSFTVRNGKIRDFKASGATVRCIGSITDYGDNTRSAFSAHIATAPIVNQRVNTTEKVMDGDEELGEHTLKGRFSGKRASGTIEQLSYYCSGKYRWRVSLVR